MSITATLEELPPPVVEATLPTAGPARRKRKWFTTEQLLELPEDDGMDREIIRGRLYEKPMTYRSTPHSRLTAMLSHVLLTWLEGQPHPRGAVLGGEAGFRVRRAPDTTVGIDVVYISAAQNAASRDRKAPRVIEGVPVLAVEVLSPSDQIGKIYTKVEDYLRAGTPLVWLVEPTFETITVYRPDAAPELFNQTHVLTAEPHLPGFRVPVAEIFA